MIRDQVCAKENFDFGDPGDVSLGLWPQEHQLPGFRDAAIGFYEVLSAPECHILAFDRIRIALLWFLSCWNVSLSHLS